MKMILITGATGFVGGKLMAMCQDAVAFLLEMDGSLFQKKTKSINFLLTNHKPYIIIKLPKKEGVVIRGL